MLKTLRNRTVLEVGLVMMLYNTFDLACRSILVVYQLNLGATLFQINLIGTVTSIMSLVEIPFGMISDRYGRKYVLIIGRIMIFSSTVIQSVATTPTHLILAAFVGATAAAGFLAVFSTMIMDATKTAEERKAALGAFYFLASLGLIAGPALASILLQYSLVTPRNLYQIFAVYLIFDLLFIIFKVKETTTEASRARVISYRTRLSTVLKKRNIQAIFIMSPIFALSTSMMTTYLPIYAITTLHFTDAEVASFQLARNIATALIRFATLTFLAKLPTKPHLIGTILLGGATGILAIQANTYPVLILVCLLEGISFGSLRILDTTIIAGNTTSDNRGTANSFHHVTQSTSMITKMFTTPIAETQGIPAVLTVGAAAAFLSLIPIFFVQ
ncbi:MFS transporter [Candidatus Bathyarchaeota archaeon]|nr:MFS transporter [Candidatus Bathyarchaeota archaeon]